MLCRVRLRGFLLFGCGQLGLMTLARFFFQWVLDFASEPVSPGAASLFAASAVGLVFFGFRLFDGLTDPLAGILSDTWTKSGRQRRTLLWLSFFLPPLGLALVFAPTAVMGPAMRWGLLAGGMFVFFVGYTLYAIPYWSLLDDYSEGDLVVRAKLSNILGAAALVATGLGFALSPALVESYGFLAAAIMFAIPCGLLMVLPYYARGRKGPASIPKSGASTTSSSESARQAIRLAFTHRRFLAVIVLFAGGQMSFTVMTAAAPFFAVDLLGGSKSDVAMLLGPFLLTAIPGFIAVPRMTARWGWEKTTLFATLALGLVYGAVGLLGQGVIGSPPVEAEGSPHELIADETITAMIVFSLGGPMAAVLLGLEGEAITGSAAEQKVEVTSIYFGVYNFVVKGLNGMALYVTGLLAEASQTIGVVAVRAMGWTAGGLLVVGVVGYWVLQSGNRASVAGDDRG